MFSCAACHDDTRGVIARAFLGDVAAGRKPCLPAALTISSGFTTVITPLDAPRQHLDAAVTMSEMTGRFVSAAATQVQAPTDVHADAPAHVQLAPSDPNDMHPHKPQLLPGGPDNSLGRRDGEGTAYPGTATIGTVPQPSLTNEL